MEGIAFVSGLIGLALIGLSFTLGPKGDESRSLVLKWGIGLTVFGVIAGNQILAKLTGG
jgi:hypothetical protein